MPDETLIKTPQPYAALLGALQLNFTDGKYSDLKIQCGDHTFKVHKLVLCGQSKFFANACDGGFREATSGEIDLSADEPEAVKAMLQYLYTFDYDEYGPPDDIQAALESHVKGSHNKGERHAWKQVYALADKYDIASLRTLSCKKLEESMGNSPSSCIGAPLNAVVQLVYTMTPVDQHCGLRDVVVKFASKHSEQLFRQETGFGKMMAEVGEFGKELAEYLAKKMTMQGLKRYRCNRIPGHTFAVAMEPLKYYACCACEAEMMGEEWERYEIKDT